MSKPFSELSRSLTDTLAYRFSNFFRSPNFTVANFYLRSKKSQGFLCFSLFNFQGSLPSFQGLLRTAFAVRFRPSRRVPRYNITRSSICQAFFSNFFKFFSTFLPITISCGCAYLTTTTITIKAIKNFEYFVPK